MRLGSFGKVSRKAMRASYSACALWSHPGPLARHPTRNTVVDGYLAVGHSRICALSPFTTMSTKSRTKMTSSLSRTAPAVRPPRKPGRESTQTLRYRRTKQWTSTWMFLRAEQHSILPHPSILPLQLFRRIPLSPRLPFLVPPTSFPALSILNHSRTLPLPLALRPGYLLLLSRLRRGARHPCHERRKL